MGINFSVCTGGIRFSHNMMDFFLAVVVGLLMAGTRFLLSVELSLMIGIVSLAGHSRGIGTGVWAACGILT